MTLSIYNVSAELHKIAIQMLWRYVTYFACFFSSHWPGSTRKIHGFSGGRFT